MYGLYVTDEKIFFAASKGKKEPMLTSGKIVNLEKGLVINGFIQDAEKLKEVIAPLVSKQKNFVFLVNSSTIIYRQLKMPVMGPEALDQYVYNTMINQLPNSSEYLIDYLLIPSKDENTLQVLAAALPQGLYSDYVKLLNSLGIKKFRFTTSGVSFVSYMSHCGLYEKYPYQIFATSFGNSIKSILYHNDEIINFSDSRQPAKTNLVLGLAQKVLELVQYQHTKDSTESVSRVIIASEQDYNHKIAEALSTQLGIPVITLDDDNDQFERSQLLAVTGSFYPEKKNLDFNTSKRFNRLKEKGSIKAKNKVIKQILKINLIVIVLMAVIVWGADLYFKYQTSQLNQKMNEATFASQYEKAAQLSADVDTYTQLVASNTLIKNETQQGKQPNASYFAQLNSLAGEITFNKITVDQTHLVTLDCSSESRTSGYAFVAALNSQADNYHLTSLTYTGFDYSEEVYRFTVSFQYVSGVN